MTDHSQCHTCPTGCMPAGHVSCCASFRRNQDEGLCPNTGQFPCVDPFSVKVSVYKNLRTDGWSIKTAERVGDVAVGKVIGHADELVLTGCEFVTKRAAIERMVAGDGPRGHKRNVFAWITGSLSAGGVAVTGWQRVVFHPFERADFFDAETGETVTYADVVWFDCDGKCWVAS